MSNAIIHPHQSVIGLAHSFASREDGSIVRTMREHIDMQIQTRLATITDILEETFCRALVQDLHQLFLEYGDRDEYRQRYGADAVGWYLANGAFTLLHIEDFRITFCHIGDLPVYAAHSTMLEQVVPIHNIQCEMAANTIEDSYLAPFATRSNREIANQLFNDVPEKLLCPLVDLDRPSFCAKLGHITTRGIGYFVEATQPHWLAYPRQAPMPAYGTRHTCAGERLCFYLPRLEEYRGSYDEAAIVQSVQQLQRQPPLPPQDIVNTTVQPGQALVVEIGDTGTLHQVWVIHIETMNRYPK